jgi:catechol 2,3-dioxygenase-like lactoylglutathione lyase family enzyme
MAVIPMARPEALIDRVCLTVPDLERATTFYRDALHFSPLGAASSVGPDRAALLGVPHGLHRSQALRLGRQTIDLFAFDPPGEPYPEDSTASDLWFQHCAIVVGDMAMAVAGLTDAGIRPITQGGPQTLPPNTGGVTAFKFRDPFGHPLELLALPAGVGDPAWHEPGSAVFKGIDHTAIAVSDAERSARFYETLFGFESGARSVNQGPAQARLDGIANVTVEVVPLLPSHAPPHLELLGYRTGRRRARRTDWTPRHQAITRTLVTVADLAAVVAAVAVGGSSFPVRRGRWDGHEAVALQDPDGHAVIIRSAT